jgi:hypothetical protein
MKRRVPGGVCLCINQPRGREQGEAQVEAAAGDHQAGRLFKVRSIFVVRQGPCGHGVEAENGISRTLQLAKESFGCLRTKGTSGVCRPLNLGIPFEDAFLLEAR